MEMKSENVVNLIEEMIDLKIRQALLVKDLSDGGTYAKAGWTARRCKRSKSSSSSSSTTDWV
jgi:hypothetical protein